VQRVLRWGLARHHHALHDHALRVMITRESPPPRQVDPSSHELPPRIPSDPPQPSECPFGPRKDWHANRDELRNNRSEHENRENPSGQKSSHLFFVRRSLCQETPNKEGATVITPFLPPGFSRISACKTRQPEPSRPDPTKGSPHQITSKRGLGHISRNPAKFSQG
jgi:hypothetical protein